MTLDVGVPHPSVQVEVSLGRSDVSNPGTLVAMLSLVAGPSEDTASLKADSKMSKNFESVLKVRKKFVLEEICIEENIGIFEKPKEK